MRRLTAVTLAALLALGGVALAASLSAPRKAHVGDEVTGSGKKLKPGRYVLVHRANPERELRERSYANNAASVLLALRGRAVRVLASCPDSARCGT